jgi:hypothetical protein
MRSLRDNSRTNFSEGLGGLRTASRQRLIVARAIAATAIVKNMVMIAAPFANVY